MKLYLKYIKNEPLDGQFFKTFKFEKAIFYGAVALSN